MPSTAHAHVVSALSHQLYSCETSGENVWVGGGTIEMEIPGTQRQIVRQVDIGLGPRVSTAGERPSAPRLIVEVEDGMRSVRDMQKLYCEYFQLMPMLRGLLLVKVLRHEEQDFSLLMMLYRRDVGGRVVCADAVSFGSGLLAPGTKAYVARSEDLRALPIVPLPGLSWDTKCPWAASQRPFLLIPAADYFYKGSSADDTSPDDLRIDLWAVFLDVVR
jgi:hypothetical protein